MDWMSGLYRHVADRTRTFWWMNAAIAGATAVVSLAFGLLARVESEHAGGIGGAIALGACAAFFVGGALLTPRERP